ncbi:MAG: OmpA family protein [Vicinamibacterales bacterium]
MSVRASGDRWLFGYADVVTLLFACFASLYAAKISPAPVATPHHDLLLALEAQPAPADPSATLRQQLEAIIEHDAAGTSVDISTTARGLVLSLEEAGSFPAGRADLTPAATRVMLVVSNALRFLPNLIRVEGHTDDTPIRGSLFSSNWELSTARATRVVRLLSEQGAVDPSRLSAAGYAEYRPRMANDSPEARARNRRVDIVVLDVSAQQDEPAALVR